MNHQNDQFGEFLHKIEAYRLSSFNSQCPKPNNIVLAIFKFLFDNGADVSLVQNDFFCSWPSSYEHRVTILIDYKRRLFGFLWNVSGVLHFDTNSMTLYGLHCPLIRYDIADPRFFDRLLADVGRFVKLRPRVNNKPVS